MGKDEGALPTFLREKFSQAFCLCELGLRSPGSRCRRGGCACAPRPAPPSSLGSSAPLPGRRQTATQCPRGRGCSAASCRHRSGRPLVPAAAPLRAGSRACRWKRTLEAGGRVPGWGGSGGLLCSQPRLSLGETCVLPRPAGLSYPAVTRCLEPEPAQRPSRRWTAEPRACRTLRRRSCRPHPQGKLRAPRRRSPGRARAAGPSPVTWLAARRPVGRRIHQPRDTRPTGLLPPGPPRGHPGVGLGSF